MSWQTMRLVAILTVLLPAFGLAEARAETLTVGAASSLTDVLPKLIEAYKAAEAAPDFKTTFDATSRLAKQIEQGAPMDVFLATDDDFSKKLNDRRTLAGGHLVVIVPAGQTQHFKSLKELAAAPPKKLALAGENVPAGKYAEAALKASGVWDDLKAKVVRADNVRAALKWVAVGEAEVGIVYLSDVINEPRVRLALGIESATHPPIHYVGGIVAASKKQEQAKKFLDFLQSDAAKAIFVTFGFTRL